MTPLTPPVAAVRPHELTAFGDTRIDPYYWLRERDNPEVISYLEAENAYADALLEHLDPLRAKLFGEIKARVQENDTSPPTPRGEWEYYARTVEGSQYPIHCRRPRGGGNEHVLLDQNVLAEGHDFMSCVGPVVSPDHTLALYAVDTDGSERYTLRARDLDTGDDFADLIADISPNMVWATNSVFFYTRHDETLRPYQLRRHVLGADPAADPVVYEDLDERFFVGASRSLTERFLLIHSGSKISDEWWVIPTTHPEEAPRLIEARVDGLEYEVVDDGERFVVVTNADGAVDFKVMTAPTDEPKRDNWTELLGARNGVRVLGVDAFAQHLIVIERENAVHGIRVLDRATGDQHVIEQTESVYTANVAANAEFDTTTLRYVFTSMNTPTTWIDYDLLTRDSTIVKQTEVRGDFAAADYVTAREWAVAADGTRVPISIVHRADVARDGTAPCLLYGYGSYEASMDPSFSILRLNLVDRGVVFAIAHVRGGGEMGRHWYEDGKMLHKRNTFIDFIACAQHMVEKQWCAADRIVARGGSAGGLLMGAVANLAPERFAGVVAEVPFVDVVTTMSDETIPLTVTEWEEWGNPRDNEDEYRYMCSYSPYDNVEAKGYPALYVEAGLNDPRVQYWEPAKWVAKLRATKTDTNPLVLRTEMGAGHSGPSGRYGAWNDEARAQAFILHQLRADT